jgi:signal transduction histidine kinase
MARELAHQMGTPLSSLSGWTEILRLPSAERGEMASDGRIAEVMSADVERLARVSHRFELIGKKPQLERTDLGEVIGEIDRYFRPRLPRLGDGVITLRTRVAGDLPEISANPVLLAWAIENVVKNAVDALAGRGGRIVVHAGGVDDERVYVRIGDNGPGISTEVRDRIFDAGVSTKSAGWGVGLSLTRRIVEELHDGKVSARARPRGGTVFEITLPVADAARAAGAEK